MDLKRNEPLVRGLAFFVPGVIGFLYSLLYPYAPNEYMPYFAMNLIKSVLFLVLGLIVIALFLTGKMKAPTKFPNLSNIQIMVIIGFASVPSVLIVIFSVLTPAYAGGIFIPITLWILLAYNLLITFEQRKTVDTPTNNTEEPSVQ